MRLALLLLSSALVQAQSAAPASDVNSLGMRLVRVPAGVFRMGNDAPTPAAQYGQLEFLTHGDPDEQPVHEVRISRDFFISETEVTARQFARFRFDHQDTGRFSPSATGVSWHDAVRFTEWLSWREKKNYRLPTEAEWEYAARLGVAKTMDSAAAEWVLDWYGAYPPEPQTDPTGPARGYSRVVRGGGIMGSSYYDIRSDLTLPFYRRAANRASAPPDFRGQHNIGFRIVEGPLPPTAPWMPDPEPATQFVKQTRPPEPQGPAPAQPWLRQRALLPIPPENAPEDAIRAVGLPPSVLGHLHAGGLTVCSNGDLLASWFASSTPGTEYEANTSFVMARLRYGSDQWDMPGPFYDFADVNDQSSLLWNDGGTLWHFSGGVGLTGVPFRIQQSRDNGARWEVPRLPFLLEPLGGYWPQPISSAFRAPDGVIFFGNDAVGGESMLWASRDNGWTWFDTGGRTAGRHTVFVRLKDGSILGIGGKNTDIDGYMPQAVSRDNGKTWTTSKTPFPALGSNQRPSLLRLASGRLFFASDWQERRGARPAGIQQRGVFVALSSDEGKTWTMKTLPGGLPHESTVLPDSRHKDWLRRYHHEATLGYSVAAQAPNGVIHLLSTMNHPSQHWELNEAWILADGREHTAVKPGAGAPSTARETHPDGTVKAVWSGRTDSSGRYVLHGPETWFYASGVKQYEAMWRDGVKTGAEVHWRENGAKAWEWEHRDDGTAVWTQYWRNGQKRSLSHWRGRKAHGEALLWDYDGRVAGRFEFREGERVR